MAEIDLADLRLRSQRVREFSAEIAGRTFSLRFPNRFEAERISAKHAGDMVAIMYDYVVTSVQGWEGVTVADALPEAKNGADLLPYSLEAARWVFEERTDWVAHLGGMIVQRLVERQTRIEADRKN